MVLIFYGCLLSQFTTVAVFPAVLQVLFSLGVGVGGEGGTTLMIANSNDGALTALWLSQ